MKRAEQAPPGLLRLVAPWQERSRDQGSRQAHGAPGPGASAAQLTAGLISLSQQPLGLPLLIELGESDAGILLLEQDPIDGIDPLQALLDGGEHLLLQESDLLYSIGPINPAAPQRLANRKLQDALHAAERGLQQQKRILHGAAKRTFRCDAAEGREKGRGHGEVRRGHSDGTDPSGGPTQEGLMLERAGARPQWSERQSGKPYRCKLFMSATQSQPAFSPARLGGHSQPAALDGLGCAIGCRPLSPLAC